MLKTDVKRVGRFTPIPKWVRNQVTRGSCQVCHHGYGRLYMAEKGIRNPKQVLDHLIPRRWLHEHHIFEHHPSNLLSVCNYCHAPKAKLEDRLYQGDVLSYLQGLSRLGYPVGKIVHFAVSVGLTEFKGVNI